MATIIVMPRLSPTMEEGVLAKWTKNEGEKVSPGDIIAEVETDKANMDFPLEDEGVMLKQLVGAGETVKLGAPVAILGEAGEDISALLTEARGAAAGQTPAAASAPAPHAPAAAQASAKPQTPVGAESPAIQAAPAGPPPAEGGGEGTSAADVRTLASPLARRLAGDAGLDIRQVKGSGPGGRVIKRDIERTLAEVRSGLSAQAPAAAPLGVTAPIALPAAGEVVPLSMMRKAIARRMTEAKQTVPHFYLTTESGVDALWHFREELNAAAGDPEHKVSVNDLVVKAVARALRLLPPANMSYSPEGGVRHPQVDIGVAVSIEDGLITPVVRNADVKSIGAIAAEVRDLAARARQKKLRPEEYQGATFSVSNLGMYGIREFLAIINPPESGIIAVGRVEKRPVVVEEDGKDVVAVQRRMTLTLSCDHRILDGALGARLLAEVVKGLEQPLLLVL